MTEPGHSMTKFVNYHLLGLDVGTIRRVQMCKLHSLLLSSYATAFSGNATIFLRLPLVFVPGGCGGEVKDAADRYAALAG